MREIALFEKALPVTPVVKLSGEYGPNHFFMKRDDMLPFCFGGNKVRKAAEFYHDIKASGADVIMTYGSNSSNHCRIIANMAASMGLDCHIISPEENREILYNTALVTKFGATIETCPVTEVAQTIEARKESYRREGRTPYFIQGGGHGRLGTESYVKAYREIADYEKETGICFDYIFHASGTGATQAGLVCGKLLARDRESQIIGISIAREEDRGRQVVKESIREYLEKDFEGLYREEDLIFTDAYRIGGYGKYNDEVSGMIRCVMEREGVPMDTTYVGKAFAGMCKYLEQNQVREKNILFIHTGGTPLYFDHLNECGEI